MIRNVPGTPTRHPAVRTTCVRPQGAAVQTLTPDTVPVVIKDDNVEVRMTEVGQMTVSFIRLAEGTDLGPALVGLKGDSCPCPHWGYMLEGRLLMRVPGGDRTYEADRPSTGRPDTPRSP